MVEIFLSYAREGSNIAKKLTQKLEKSGYSVWRDVEKLRVGEQWPQRTGEAIASCHYFLLLWSKKSSCSDFVNYEWNTAYAMKKKMIVCILDKIDPPNALRGTQCIFMSNFETAFIEILKAINGHKEPDAKPKKKRFKKRIYALTITVGIVATLAVWLNQSDKINWKNDNEVNKHKLIGKVTDENIKEEKDLPFLDSTKFYQSDIQIPKTKPDNTIALPVKKLVNLSGTVLDEKLNLIEGAKITIIGRPEFTYADTHGYFRLVLSKVESENLHILVVKDRFLPWKQVIEINQSNIKLEVNLTPSPKN